MSNMNLIQVNKKPQSSQLPDKIYDNEQAFNNSYENEVEEEEEQKQNQQGDKQLSHSQGELSYIKKEKNNKMIKNIYINYPVIAVLSIPSGFAKFPKEQYSYIYTSYIQYFQQSGVRVIPLKWTETEDQIKCIMNKVNGLVLTGGGANLMARQQDKDEKEFTPFSKAGINLIKIAKEKNDQGNYFPIWGTCLGFELILLSFTSSEIRNIFDSKNHFAKQIFNIEMKDKSRILSGCAKSQLKYLSEEAFFFYNHKNAISKQTYLSNPKLNQNFNCISYSQDLKGKTFVSIAEAKNYPFYGTQFHPEKLQFEHSPQFQKQLNIQQLKISQHFPNFFYTECLKSTQRFESLQEQQQFLIENYQPIYLQNYEQGMYIFNNQGKDLSRVKDDFQNSEYSQQNQNN